MFGYIYPLESELKVRELDLYKAVYCGLCDTLSKELGVAARFTLSYDFTFTAMIMMGLSDTPPQIQPKACPYNPLKKKPHVIYNDQLAFSANVAAMLVWAKNIDNIEDDPFPKNMMWRLALPFTQRASGKGREHYNKAFLAVEELISFQREAEQNPNASFDMVAHPSSNVLSKLFSLMSEDEKEKRILSRLGYMMGRYCYICDAIDDIEKDCQQNKFNPLKTNNDVLRLKSLVNSAIAEATKAYELLDIKYFKEILDNIIYLGLQNKANELIIRRENSEGSI